MYKAGDRVGAILGEKNGVVDFLGYGIYEGDFDPDNKGRDNPKAVGAVAEMGRRLGRLNPRIKLDNGKTVWGCECWWGSEVKIRATLEQRKASGSEIREVDIDIIRAKFNEDVTDNEP